MSFPAAEYVFKAPPILAHARRVLIKPCAAYAVPYPVTTSLHMVTSIIEGIRAVSDADILVLEGTTGGDSIYPIYKEMGYNFPRVLLLDVKDCIWVEVENPLTKPLAVPTFWIPNVILSSDYLISVTPARVIDDRPILSIANLLSLLPTAKYHPEKATSWQDLYTLGMDKVIADLYFTLPFDFGIIEAKQKFTTTEADSSRGKTEEIGLTFAGEPLQIDTEAVEKLGLKAEYLNLIREAQKELGI